MNKHLTLALLVRLLAGSSMLMAAERQLTEKEKKYAGLAEKPDIEALAAKVPLRDASWTKDDRPRPCIYFPEGVKTVRGLYIAPTMTSMDPRDAMRVLQFAWLHINWEQGSDREFFLLARDGVAFLRPYLRALGKKFGHPELEHVPIMLEGWQGEAGPVIRDFYEKVPGQFLGAAHDWSWPRQPAELRRTIPFIGMGESAPEEGARAEDAVTSSAVHYDFGHGMWGKQVYYWIFTDQLIKTRLPFDTLAERGPVALMPLRAQDGWLGDSKYQAAAGGNWTDKIAPFNEYPGNKTKAVWFPTEYMACVWRAQCVKNDTPIEIEGPVTRYKKGGTRRNARGESFDCGLGVGYSFLPGQEFDITVQVNTGKFPVASVEYYDGNIKLGESTAAPFTLKNVSFSDPGIYVLIAVAVTADGRKACSHPAPLPVLGDMYVGTTYGERHHGNGVVVGARPPVKWWRHQNLQWTATLPGAGRSAAVPVSTRVFAVCEPDQLVCLDRREGKILWQTGLTGPDDKPGKGTGPTPFASRLGVFTATDSGVVNAHELGGKRLWRAAVEPGARMASPLLCGNVLLVQGAKLSALDARTGKLLWDVPLPDQAEYGAPEKAAIGDDYLVLTGWGAAVRLRDGKVLADNLPRAVGSSPVVAGGVAYWSGDKTVAVRLPAKAEEGAKFEELWSARRAGGATSPVALDGLLYVLTAKNELVALDAVTGQEVYARSLTDEGGTAGSLVAANGRLYIANLGAKHRTAIVKAGREFAPVWEYFAAAATPPPTFLADRQYVRVGARLHAVGGADPAEPVAPAFVKPAPLQETPADTASAALVLGEAPTRWLTLGPLTSRDLKTDHLAALDGREKAVPTVGAEIEWAGGKHAFRPLATNVWWTSAKFTGNVPVITLINGAQKCDQPSIAGTNFNNTTYLFTVLKNDTDRYVKLNLWAPGQYDNRDDMDFRAWLGGQPVTKKDVIRLPPGDYPFLLQLSVGTTPPWGLGWVRPHFLEAGSVGAAVQKRYEEALAKWPQYAEEAKQPCVLE